MHERQRARDGFYGLSDRGMLTLIRLERGKGATHRIERLWRCVASRGTV